MVFESKARALAFGDNNTGDTALPPQDSPAPRHYHTTCHHGPARYNIHSPTCWQHFRATAWAPPCNRLRLTRELPSMSRTWAWGIAKPCKWSRAERDTPVSLEQRQGCDNRERDHDFQIFSVRKSGNRLWPRVPSVIHIGNRDVSVAYYI